MLLLILTLMAIAGAIYVAYGKALTANCLWSVSNLGFVFHNMQINEPEMAVLFAVYEVICIFGIWNLTWNKK